MINRINIGIRPFSINRYYTVYRGHTNISASGRLWRDKILDYIKDLDITLTDKPLHVIYDFGFSSMEQDIDASIKPLQDTLEGIIWVNDIQIVKLEVNKYIVKEDFISIEWNELKEN